MLRSRRTRWGLLIAVAILGLTWIQVSRVHSGASTPATIQEARIGFPAPNFTLQRPDGQSITLTDLQGQAVILNFWATWCPPCRAEMPTLEKLYHDRQGDGVIVLGVNQMETSAQVERFLDQFGLTFPVVLDTQGDVGRMYRVRALPTTYFIDRRGVIRDMVIGGPMSEALLRSKVAALLGE